MFSKNFRKDIHLSHTKSGHHGFKEGQSGFSFIELLVTSAIITVVTAIVIVKHNSFNNAVLLRNQTYEIALAIREAQVYAVSARGDGTDFRERYGIFFRVNNQTNRQQAIIYINEDANYRYTSADDSVLETIILDSRFEVTDVCVDTISDGEICIRDNSNRLSVSFQRPDFDPYFTIHDGVHYGADVSAAKIKIAPVSNSSLTRTIEITQTGQISVQ